MRLFRATLPVFALALLVAGCDQSLTESGSPSQSPSGASSQAGTPPDLNPLVERLSPQEVSRRTMDAQMAQLARDHEGFAGFYRAKNGAPTILLADKSITSATFLPLVVPKLKTMFGRTLRKLLEKRAPVVRYVEHDFDELKSWKDASANVFNIEGVLSLDIDERENALAVGIESENVRDKVQAKLKQVGVPADEVVFEKEEPVQEEKTLRDSFRPVKAGVEISPACTLGYNGEDASGNLYFVTNSHCTQQRFALDGGATEQPLSGSEIGVEVGDPPVSGDYEGCPSGRRCRYSDAALIKYGSGVDHDKVLARPKKRTAGGQEGDPDVRSTIDVRTNFTGYPPARIIIQRRNDFSIYVGQTLDRIGRTSGWTYGDVTDTCVSIQKPNTDITMLCQTRAEYGSDGGDSGSPVFNWVAPNPYSGPGSFVTYARIAGIHWGGYGNSPMAVFSTFKWVENEIGELQIENPDHPDCC